MEPAKKVGWNGSLQATRLFEVGGGLAGRVVSLDFQPCERQMCPPCRHPLYRRQRRHPGQRNGAAFTTR